MGISEEMIQIAENIQTLHNSLASDIVENLLSAKTELLETSYFEITIEEDDGDNYENVLAGIGELYATLTNVKWLKEDSISLDPKFRMSQDKESSEVIQDLESLIEQGNPRKTSEPTERFWPTYQNLNTLALSTTTITRTQANEGSDGVEKEIISANGTWQSIQKWGENEMLDDDQQMAFEILAATYILTFSDEAIMKPRMPLM
jgi:hypothetical protein